MCIRDRAMERASAFSGFGETTVGKLPSFTICSGTQLIFSNPHSFNELSLIHIYMCIRDRSRKASYSGTCVPTTVCAVLPTSLSRVKTCWHNAMTVSYTHLRRRLPEHDGRTGGSAARSRLRPLQMCIRDRGISRSYVSRIEKKAVQKLTKAIEAHK